MLQAVLTDSNGQVDSSVGVDAEFYSPRSLVFDKNGGLLVLDKGTNLGLRQQYIDKAWFDNRRCFSSLVRKISLSGSNPVTTIAGQRVEMCDVVDHLDNDGDLLSAILYTGSQLNINPVNGDLYMSQLSDGKIRQITGQSVITFPGTRFMPDINNGELWSKIYVTDQGVAYGNGKLFANGYWRPNIRQYSIDGGFDKEFDLQSAGCQPDNTQSLNNGGVVFYNDALYTTCGKRLVRVLVDNGSVDLVYTAPSSDISSIASGNGYILFSYSRQIYAFNIENERVIDIIKENNDIPITRSTSEVDMLLTEISGLALSDTGQVYFSMSNGRIYRVDDVPSLTLKTEL